jgi:hypothetical protein
MSNSAAVINEDIDNIWDSSLIVFDTNSILRIYEWISEKSYYLKDIFDYKNGSIWSTNQIKKEVMDVYNLRIEDKKKRFTHAIEGIFTHKNPVRLINGYKKLCEGYYFPSSFLKELDTFIDGIITKEQVYLRAKEYEQQFDEFFISLPIDFLWNDYFSNVYNSTNIDTDLTAYQNAIHPPGYKDKGKKQNQNGDYIIWNELIGLSVEKNSDITFVTADGKPDWFRNGKAREELLEDFSKAVNGENKINIISLTDFLEISNNYIGADITGLINESYIEDMITEKYDTYYPEDLAEMAQEYVNEDRSNFINEIENAVDSCVDDILFSGLLETSVSGIEYEINESEGCIYITIDVDFEVEFDTQAHCSGEDIDLGSPSLNFSAILTGMIDIEWQSADTTNKALSDPYDFEIVELVFKSANPLYDTEDEEHEYDYDHDYLEEEYGDHFEDDFNNEPHDDEW